jgi:hypothetical protein
MKSHTPNEPCPWIGERSHDRYWIAQTIAACPQVDAVAADLAGRRVRVGAGIIGRIPPRERGDLMADPLRACWAEVLKARRLSRKQDYRRTPVQREKLRAYMAEYRRRKAARTG